MLNIPFHLPSEIVSTIDRLQQQQQNHTSAMPHHAEPALSTAVAADALAEAILHNTSHKHSVVSSTTSESPDHASAHNEALQVQGDVDSFDHILQATSQHEAVYAYYYMDENNKVHIHLNTYLQESIYILNKVLSLPRWRHWIAQNLLSNVAFPL